MSFDIERLISLLVRVMIMNDNVHSLLLGKIYSRPMI